MSVSFYRKYRPQTFDDVVGQDHIEKTLRNAVAANTVSHAYLFCGPRGTGKTTTARLLAKALLCENGPTPNPDGTCEQCEAISKGTHPDVNELDAASRTGVDNVREEIIGRVMFAPVRGRYKVYIIDEVHMLSIAAFNALLKTLEEPPSHVVFILCTTDPHKVPDTILSRCQRFDFHRIPVAQIAGNLAMICSREGIAFEEAALELIAAHASGGMRDAITTLEQLAVFTGGNVTYAQAQGLLGQVEDDELHEILQHIANRDMAACFAWTASFAEKGIDVAQFSREMTRSVRNLYVTALTQGAAGLEGATADEIERYKLLAHAFGGADRLSRMLLLLGDLNAELRYSADPRLSLEIAFMRMTRPDSDLTLESLAERVEALENGALAIAFSGASFGAPAAVTAPAPVMSQSAATQPTTQTTAQPATQPAVQPVAQSATQPTAQQQPVPPQTQTGEMAAPAVLNDAIVQRLWASASREIKKARPLLTGVIFNARVMLGDEDMMIIELPAGEMLMKRLAEEPENRSFICDVLAKTFGRPIPLRFTLSSAEEKAPQQQQVSQQPAAQLQPQQQSTAQPQPQQQPAAQPQPQQPTAQLQPQQQPVENDEAGESYMKMMASSFGVSPILEEVLPTEEPGGATNVGAPCDAGDDEYVFDADDGEEYPQDYIPNEYEEGEN